MIQQSGSRSFHIWLTWKFQEVKFQGACDYGDFVTFQDFSWDRFSCIDGIAEVMGGRQRYVY